MALYSALTDRHRSPPSGMGVLGTSGHLERWIFQNISQTAAIYLEQWPTKSDNGSPFDDLDRFLISVREKLYESFTVHTVMAFTRWPRVAVKSTLLWLRTSFPCFPMTPSVACEWRLLAATERGPVWTYMYERPWRTRLSGVPFPTPAWLCCQWVNVLRFIENNSWFMTLFVKGLVTIGTKPTSRSALWLCKFGCYTRVVWLD